MSLLRSPLLLAILLFLVAVAPAPAQIEYRPYEIERFCSARTVATKGETAEITFTMAGFEPDRLPSRANFNFWALSAPEVPPAVELVSARWGVLLNDKTTSGPFTLGEVTSWGRLPDTMVVPRVTYVDSFRGFGLARVELTPVMNASRVSAKLPTIDTLYLMEATYKLTVRRGSPADVDPAVVDPYGLSLVRVLAANPDQAALVYRPPAGLEREGELQAWNAMLARGEAARPVLAARLDRPGLYTIDAALLRESGISPETLPINDYRVLLGPDEVPVLLEGLQGQRLLGSARAVFYAPASLFERKPFAPLWLIPAAPGETPLRATALPSPPNPLTAPAIPGSVVVDLFAPNEYNHALPPNGPFLRWATANVAVQSQFHMDFEVFQPDPENAATIEWWWANSHARSVTKVRLWVNGMPISEGDSRGIRLEQRSTSFPGDLLRSGTNRLTFENISPADVQESVPVFFLAARLEAPVLSPGVMPHQVFVSNIEQPGPVLMRMGFGSPATRDQGFLLEVTNPFRPVYTRLLGGRGDFPDALSGGMTVDTVRPRFLFSPADTLLRPSGLAVAAAPHSFTDRAPADYLVIHHPRYTEALKPLLQHRRAQGLNVAAYTVDDIYAAFSHGAKRYEAIRDFIQHALARRDGARPREVLLVGEGSEYWWEHRSGRSGVNLDEVPVFGWADPKVRIRGDDSYVLVAGKGPLADLEIGRLSVASPEELSGVITKILNYETNPPIGEWLGHHLFVTDDEPEFDRVMEEIIYKSLHGPNMPKLLSLSKFPYEDYFRGVWRKRSTTMTDKLIEEWSQGARTITYLGHGGPNLWSSERILHIRDLDRVSNQGRHPLMIAGSCDTGWVDYPIDPVKASLAEHFMRKPDGGVIAAFIPIDGTSSYEHNYLLTAFHRAMLQDGIQDVGTLSLLSKVNYHVYRNNPAVSNQYLLMGDPGTRLVKDPPPLQLAVSPPFLLKDTGEKLVVTGSTDQLRWGMAQIDFLDPAFKSVASARARVVEGRFEETLALPPQLTPGEYRLIVNAFNESERAQAASVLNITVAEARIRIAFRTRPELDRLLPAGTPVEILTALYNPTLIDLQSGFLQFVDKETGKELGRAPVAIGPGQTIVRQLRAPLPPGLLFVEARLFKDESEIAAGAKPVSSNVLRLRGGDPSVPFVAFSRTEIEFQRLRRDGKSLIRMNLHNMTDEPLRGMHAVLRRQVGGEAVAVGPITPVPVVPARGSAQFEMTAFRTLEPGRHTFVFDLLDPIGEEPVILLEEQAARTNDIATTFTLLQRAAFSRDLELGPDLEIVDGQLALENENPVAGMTVFARFVVRNVGDTTVDRVRGRLFLNAPWITENEPPNVVPWGNDATQPQLRPGESAEFRIRWDPPIGTPGSVRLFATVDSGTDIVEVDMANNVVERTIALRRPPNLAVRTAEIRRSHQYITPYDTVAITVPFANESPFDFVREFRASVYARSFDGTRRRLFMRRFDSLFAGERATLQFDWVVRPGEHTLEVDLNEDREYLEQTYEDNFVTLAFEYFLEHTHFTTREVAWDFEGTEELGHAASVSLRPTGYFEPVAEPKAVQARLRFGPEWLVSGELGRRMQVDNRWGTDDGGMFLAFGETPDPVTFRWPVNVTDFTTVHDIYVSHIGRLPDQNRTGNFRYRIEGERDLRLHEPVRRGEHYLGRYDTRDGFLDMTFAGPGYPSFNHLFSIDAYPVMGVYTGPAVRAPRLPTGRIVADIIEPGDSRVHFEVRYGRARGRDVEWGDWAEVPRGSPLPAAPAAASFLQWRASLVIAGRHTPAFRNVRIERTPGTLGSVAEGVATAGTTR